MTAPVDSAPFGARAPDFFARSVLTITRALPVGWLGLRTAMVLRRLMMARLKDGALDTMVWGLRTRLYPRRNSCEKVALFTPQMYDPRERALIAEAIAQRLAASEKFTFVDIGANVGLYALFVAACAGGRARVLAIEPQPGIVDRLRFNVVANPAHRIEVEPVAVSDHDGELELMIDARDGGGTRFLRGGAQLSGEMVRVPTRPLATILEAAGIAEIDALKIDIEGAEDLALDPFLRAAPSALWPRLIVIEDRPMDWAVDLYALFAECGYEIVARTRQNVVFRRD